VTVTGASDQSRREAEPESPGRIAAMGAAGVVIGATAMLVVGFMFTSAFSSDASARPGEPASAAPADHAASPPRAASAQKTASSAAPAASAPADAAKSDPAQAESDAVRAVASSSAPRLKGSLSALLVPSAAPTLQHDHDAQDPYAPQPADAPLAKDVYDGQ
jgi:hypothetical protein